MNAALLAEDYRPVPPTANWLLLELARRSGSVNDLAARLGLAKQAVSRLADRLVSLGYCDRQRSETNRRQVWLSLTAEGRGAATALFTAIEEVDTRLLAHLDHAERETFGRVLDLLYELSERIPPAANAPGNNSRT